MLEVSYHIVCIFVSAVVVIISYALLNMCKVYFHHPTVKNAIMTQRDSIELHKIPILYGFGFGVTGTWCVWFTFEENWSLH